MATKERQDSSKLQNYLKGVKENQLKICYEKLKGKLFDFSFKKFGNYITQIFLERLPEFREEFCKLSIRNFSQMVSNEYACRVLQKLILLKDTKFINHVIDLVKHDYRPFMRNLSSVIMLNKLIINLKEKSKVEFLEKLIIQRPEIVLEEPYAIRLLVSLFTKFDDQSIRKMFTALRPYMYHLITHKFGMYVIQKKIKKVSRRVT